MDTKKIVANVRAITETNTTISDSRPRRMELGAIQTEQRARNPKIWNPNEARYCKSLWVETNSAVGDGGPPANATIKKAAWATHQNMMAANTNFTHLGRESDGVEDI